MKNYLEHIYKKFPKSTIQDFIKYTYCASFGSGHMISNKRESLERLEHEIEALPKTNNNFYYDLYDYVGSHFVRVNLVPYINYKLSATNLNELFCNSTLVTSKNQKTLTSNLDLLYNFLLSKNYNENDLNKFITYYFNNSFPILSHSEVYKANYDPHYRLIKTDYLSQDLKFYQVKNFIDNFLDSKTTDEVVMIAIDGKCCSGKTTIAHLLENEYQATIIHVDDFFDTDSNEIGINSKRLQDEVLSNLSLNKCLSYQKYNCSSNSFSIVSIERVTRLVIIEGSFSANKDLKKYYDKIIYVDLKSEIQTERLLKRSKALYHNFVNIWIPRENKYFDNEQLIKNADLIV